MEQTTLGAVHWRAVATSYSIRLAPDEKPLVRAIEQERKKSEIEGDGQAGEIRQCAIAGRRPR
jgi:hypothetical protein